jgi:hypothetical protein
MLPDGRTGSYADTFTRWLTYHLLMMVLSSGFSLALARRPALFEIPRRAAAIYAALLVRVQPGQRACRAQSRHWPQPRAGPYS